MSVKFDHLQKTSELITQLHKPKIKMDALSVGSLLVATSALSISAAKKYMTSSNIVKDTKNAKDQFSFEPIKRNHSNGEKNPYAILETQKYPAKKHCKSTKSQLSTATITESSAIFLASNQVEGVEYSDGTKPFRQNRYFFYLTGCNLPSCYVFFNMKTEKLTLFLPPVDEDDVMWSGLPMSLKEAQNKYDVDEVLYSSELSTFFDNLESFENIYTTDTKNINDKEIAGKLKVGAPEFFYALDEARSIKDAYEVALIKKACEITDKCHLAVMSALPIETNEMHMHAEFTYHALRQGAKFQGYDPICCSGPNCSTLHYVHNDDDMEHKKTVLIDAGAEWECYTADVTRCFPIQGKFTKEHREIYEAVLDMQTHVMKNIKPGTNWDDMHFLAHKVLIENFKKLGIFKKEFSNEEIFKRRASTCFFPHGLGHLLGLDTHDVGGEPNYSDPDPFLSYLRLRKPLAAGMVITNEPGIYFNDFLIEKFLEKHPERLEVVDVTVMEKYKYIGGVRIEDDVLVTKDGYENLTGITSDPDEIEQIVSNGIAKGRSHFHNIA